LGKKLPGEEGNYCEEGREGFVVSITFIDFGGEDYSSSIDRR
jgi:hypothetical protein